MKQKFVHSLKSELQKNHVLDLSKMQFVYEIKTCYCYSLLNFIKMRKEQLKYRNKNK